MKTTIKKIYTTALFMKLAFDVTGKNNGEQTLTVYEKFRNKHRSVWFSTNALANGIAENKKQDFMKAIKDGYTVEIFFAVSKNSDNKNYIVYKAEVIDIRSDAEGMTSPEKQLTPEIWRELKNNIWLKIVNV